MAGPDAAAPGLGGRTMPCALSVVVPVKNGGTVFRHLAQHLVLQVARWGIEVILIDSGSTDGSPEYAESIGLPVHRIEPGAYRHGRTRNAGVQMARGDVVCMLTHDVLPCTPDWPWVFATRFMDDPALAGCFARQVPRNADTPEMHFISANYPSEPHVYEPCEGGQIPGFGRVLFSDAFSALRRTTAIEIPYIDDIPVSEDQVWARQVTARGWRIAYEPRVEALHAHRYTFPQLYRRCYLVGQAGEPYGILDDTSTARGVGVFLREIRYFTTHGHTHRIPWLVAYEFIRWFGYKRGRASGWQPSAPVPPDIAGHPVLPPRPIRAIA